MNLASTVYTYRVFRVASLAFLAYSIDSRVTVTLLSMLIASCSPKIVLTFMKLKGRCTFVASVALLLIGVEKKT